MAFGFSGGRGVFSLGWCLGFWFFVFFFLEGGLFIETQICKKFKSKEFPDLEEEYA